MHPSYTGSQIRAAERPLLEAGHGPTLMRRAAWGMAQHVVTILRARGTVYGAHVTGLVGKGNNGADTLWALSFLAARGVAVTAVCVVSTPEDLHAAGRAAFLRSGGKFTDRHLASADVVIDGVFGTGFTGIFDMPSHLAQHHAGIGPDTTVVACDVPSGLLADTGDIPGTALAAHHTVTFGAPKFGLLTGLGAQHAGKVHVVDIGLGDQLAQVEQPWWVADDDDLRAISASPAWDAHKYSHGVLSMVAGSQTYPGAAVLVAQAALATGTGYLTVVPEPDGAQRVAHHVLAAMPQAVVQDRVHQKATAIVVGPGLGESAAAQQVAVEAMTAGIDQQIPVIVDASGLDVVQPWMFASPGTFVLTPHPGEMQRLTQRLTPNAVDLPVVEQAQNFAVQHGVWLVLKQASTTVFGPDGRRGLSPQGTSQLATAGTGDTLAGIMGAAVSKLTTSGQASSQELFATLLGAIRLHTVAGNLAAAGGRVEVSTLAAYVRQAQRQGLQ